MNFGLRGKQSTWLTTAVVEGLTCIPVECCWFHTALFSTQKRGIPPLAAPACTKPWDGWKAMLLVLMAALQFPSLKELLASWKKRFSFSCELLSDLCRLQLLQLRMQSRVHSSAGFISELGKICGHISMQKCLTFPLLFHVSSYGWLLSMRFR